MKYLSSDWSDLAEGYKEAGKFDWLAWKDGGEEVAFRFGALSDKVVKALKRYQENASAWIAAEAAIHETCRQEQESARRFVVGAAFQVVWVAAVFAAVCWAMGKAMGAGVVREDWGAVLMPFIHTGLLRGGTVAVIAGWSAIWAAASLALLRALAVKRKRAALAVLDKEGIPDEPVLMDTPNLSVRDVWVEALSQAGSAGTDVTWRQGNAAEAVVAKMGKYLSYAFVGMADVPITSTQNVDLLVVGPTGVWALELGGTVSEGDGKQQADSGPEDRGRADGVRLERAAKCVAELTRLLQDRCPGVDLKMRILGGVVRLDATDKDLAEVRRSPECEGCWGTWLEKMNEGVREELIEESDRWLILDTLARNAAELGERFGVSSVPLAQAAYDRVVAHISGFRDQGTGRELAG